jgi:hypothetical protein
MSRDESLEKLIPLLNLVPVEGKPSVYRVKSDEFGKKDGKMTEAD